MTEQAVETRRMTTYTRADGDTIGDDWAFSLDIETCENDADNSDEPVEFIEQVWVLESERKFTLPTCRECDEVARHWGLCEKHAREDDPDAFDDDPDDVPTVDEMLEAGLGDESLHDWGGKVNDE